MAQQRDRPESKRGIRLSCKAKDDKLLSDIITVPFRETYGSKHYAIATLSKEWITDQDLHSLARYLRNHCGMEEIWIPNICRCVTFITIHERYANQVINACNIIPNCRAYYAKHTKGGRKSWLTYGAWYKVTIFNISWCIDKKYVKKWLYEQMRQYPKIGGKKVNNLTIKAVYKGEVMDKHCCILQFDKNNQYYRDMLLVDSNGGKGPIFCGKQLMFHNWSMVSPRNIISSDDNDTQNELDQDLLAELVRVATDPNYNYDSPVYGVNELKIETLAR